MCFTHDFCYLSWSPSEGQAEKEGILKGPVPPGIAAPLTRKTIPWQYLCPQDRLGNSLRSEVAERTGVGFRLSGYKSAQLPTSPPSLLHLLWVPPAPVASSLPTGPKQLTWEPAWLHSSAGERSRILVLLYVKTPCARTSIYLT